MSNIHEMAFLQQKVQELKDQGLYKVPVTLDGPNEAECVINGKKVINLSGLCKPSPLKEGGNRSY